jgi:hypothetical protein
MSCGTLGSPSADNSIRTYSASECQQLGGNHYASGECLKPEGGSWSWDCRDLNNQPSVVSPQALSLLPAPSGGMSTTIYVLIGGALVAAYLLMK